MIESILDYHNSYRDVFFLSSITLGTFLLSMKTFIIQTMKKEIYDQEWYIEHIKKRQKEGDNRGVYAPLKNLTNVLLFSILSAFLNAAIQASIGYICHPWAAIICITTTIFAWLLVLAATILVSNNLRLMLSISEKNAENHAKK